MTLTPALQKILTYYDHENMGVKTNLVRFLNHGSLKGTGKFMVLAVDQGFEHGPARSFLMNPEAFDPDYFFKLAIHGGVSAYAAPLGLLEASLPRFVGQVPLILKINSNNSLSDAQKSPNQSITASVDDALRLGCIGIGITLYPGTDYYQEMIEEARALSKEARDKGLMVFVWSYARGNMSKRGETALDVVAYGAHIACLLGAHVVKVKLPTEHLEFPEAKFQYDQAQLSIKKLSDRVHHVVQCCFEGKRLVGFSGGEKKTDQEIIDEMKEILEGHGSGTFIGRNAFQRPFSQGVDLLHKISHFLKIEA